MDVEQTLKTLDRIIVAGPAKKDIDHAIAIIKAAKEYMDECKAKEWYEDTSAARESLFSLLSPEQKKEV